MKSKCFSLQSIIFIVFVCLIIPLPESALFGQEMQIPSLAQSLVNQCANIKESDCVLISGGVKDIDLLEDIAIEVRKMGAFPLITVGSDRLTRMMYTDVPAKYDSQTPMFDMELAKMVHAIIGVEFGETMGLLSDIPTERFETRNKANTPVNDIIMKRNVRQVSLGNGLYPTSELANMFGISLEQLSNIFWDGVNVDYNALQTSCNSVKQTLVSGKKIHISNPNGTDFSVQIEGRPIYVSDGVISEDDANTGGVACQVWLPAGEVYLTPVPGTAEGKVVVDRQLYQGGVIEGLTLTFKAGKLTSMTAKSGLDPLKKRYDAYGAGKDQFAIIDIGVNPNVKIVPDSKMTCWVANGMITVGVGNDEWAGGQNASAFFMANFLPGSTVKVDDKVIIEKGQLKL